MELLLEDQKIRQSWLWWTVVKIFFLPLVGTLLNLTSSFNSISYNYMALINGIFGFLALYYFSYRKFGTAWLTFTIVGLPFGIIMCIFLPFVADAEIFKDITDLLFFVVDTAIGIWWLILCIKLRRSNQNVRFRHTCSTEGYQKALEYLKMAFSIEDLYHRFGTLMREQDDGDLWREAKIVRAYEVTKRNLFTKNLPPL